LSKVSSLLRGLYKTTTGLTFEKYYNRKKFSRVSSLLILLYKVTIELTFEKYYTRKKFSRVISLLRVLNTYIYIFIYM